MGTNRRSWRICKRLQTLSILLTKYKSRLRPYHFCGPSHKARLSGLNLDQRPQAFAPCPPYQSGPGTLRRQQLTRASAIATTPAALPWWTSKTQHPSFRAKVNYSLRHITAAKTWDSGRSLTGLSLTGTPTCARHSIVEHIEVRVPARRATLRPSSYCTI